MIGRARPVERVFIDTNELFPFTVMDVLLALSEDRLFDWVWTDELLAEWERVIVRERQRTPESARSVTDAVPAWFAPTRIDPADYRPLVSTDLSPDEADANLRQPTARTVGLCLAVVPPPADSGSWRATHRGPTTHLPPQANGQPPEVRMNR